MVVSPQCLSSKSSEPHEITLAWRLGGAGIILIVSAVAASFPSLAKVAPKIAPPEIVFFIGKHFGTGVILSTAFIHLMQEGFESLNDPCLSGDWREWSGAIVLCSFLAIFLVEYISTAYVERLSATHAEHTHSKVTANHQQNPSDFAPYRDEPEESTPDADVEQPIIPAPIFSADDYGSHVRHPSRLNQKASRRSSFIGHHRHESPTAHQHRAGPRLTHWHRISTGHLSDDEAEDVRSVHSHGHGHGPDVSQEVSRKTRIISTLILQLGIMLHSLVIGLTLAITDGANFTTLLTALVFHQLFEGLSLGIRISTLPSGSRALPVILCILFAITAPIGVALGVLFLPSPHTTVSSNIFIVQEHLSMAIGGSVESQTAILTQGLMCALSAGMLIYAGGVEMLAGDFVMDPEMRQLDIWQQGLGLGSLIGGTVAMGVVSMWVPFLS